MPDQDGHTGYLLVRVCRAFRTFRSARLATLGLYCGQDLLLQALDASENIRQTDVAERLEVEAPTVTKMVQRMKRTGALARVPDPDDARAVCLRLTEEGRGLQQDVTTCWEAVEARLTQGFTAEERVLFRRLLRRVLSNLQDAAGEAPPGG